MIENESFYVFLLYQASWALLIMMFEEVSPLSPLGVKIPRGDLEDLEERLDEPAEHS